MIEHTTFIRLHCYRQQTACMRRGKTRNIYRLASMIKVVNLCMATIYDDIHVTGVGGVRQSFTNDAGSFSV